MFNSKLFLNYETLLKVDTNYGGTENFVSIKKGIKSIVPSNNEVVSQTQYQDGNGFAESHVTGGQFTLAVTAHRILNDEGQNYIMGLALKFGDDRITQAKFINGLGEVKTGEVTIANITMPNGDPAAEGDCSFEIHFNGEPEETAAELAPELAATVAAGSVTGTTSFSATSDVENSLAYYITNGEPITDVNVGMYARVIKYTANSNIPTETGKYLNMFELDADNRIVRYLGKTLSDTDIA